MINRIFVKNEIEQDQIINTFILYNGTVEQMFVAHAVEGCYPVSSQLGSRAIEIKGNLN